jgi:hypothetical protein
MGNLAKNMRKKKGTLREFAQAMNKNRNDFCRCLDEDGPFIWDPNPALIFSMKSIFFFHRGSLPCVRFGGEEGSAATMPSFFL